MNVDMDAYFDTQKPTIKIFGNAYEVDNDYKKVLAAQRKFAAPRSDEDSGAIMRELLTDNLAGGKQAADEILAHDMPFAFWNLLQFGILAAMTGKTVEQLREAGEKSQKDAQFRRTSSAKKRV
ncbi:MAG: hypothetical protein ABF449_05755 [Ethanoligenens sp.]|uniref:hypothetical protein n=1 Tax=Ethanoligenens sp. TaxID=2099655 RepID=UPI0039EA76FC